MSVVETHPSNNASDWALQLIISAAVLLLGCSVWAYTHVARPSPQSKPHPVWLGISKVLAQMSDGRMVNVKVNLRLQNQDEVKALDPHMPAFKALIEEAGTRISRESLQGGEGMQRFGAAILDTLNGYLEEQQVPNKIKGVVFEELTLMP